MPCAKTSTTSSTRKSDTVVILSGDQLYRINLRDFINYHKEKKADITIAVKPVQREQAGEFGILQIDDQRRIIRFVEKPKDRDAAGRVVHSRQPTWAWMRKT